ncbi:MAG: DUF1707 domain-containing protein [Actinomycetota bacterium]
MDQKNPRNYPPGNLRVSDADRDLALAELSEHFQAGRLTEDEMQDRTEMALKAKTGKELSAIMADLPVVRPSTSVAPKDASPQRHDFWTPVTTSILLGLVAVAIATGAFFSYRNGNSVPWWIFPIAFLILRRIGRGGSHHHYDRHRHDHYGHQDGRPPDQLD